MDIKVRCKKLCVGKKLLTPPLPPHLQGRGDISNKGNNIIPKKKMCSNSN